MPKVYKQDRDDTKVKVVYKAPFILTPACSVEQKRCRDGVLYITFTLVSSASILFAYLLACCPNFFVHFKNILSCTFGGYNLLQCTITLQNSLINDSS